jgi:hypothetical protein
MNLSDIIPLDYTGNGTPNPSNRLRSEFLKNYPHPLCADAFTEWSALDNKEKSLNDSEVVNASRYLTEHWIPSFVKKLDELEIRPINSEGLCKAFHQSGINMRYLGLVAHLSKLSFVKEMCIIDMLARTTKTIFQAKIRNAIMHFRNVGATQVDEEMKNYGTTMFSFLLGKNDKCVKFLKDKVIPEVKEKYQYDLQVSQWLGIHRPALFLALQHHVI